MRALVVGLCVVAACGSKKDDKTGGGKVQAMEPAHTSNQELVAAPLVAVDSTADGKAFSIELPMGQLKNAVVQGAYSTWNVKKDHPVTPSFTVTWTAMALKEGETGAASPLGDDHAERAITKAEALDDGGFINIDERKDQKFFNLEVCKPQAEGRLCCSVIQRDTKPIEAYAETLALAEKVCRSLKAR